MKKLLLVSLSILLLCVTQVFAQNRTITGTVTAKSDGTPLPGVTVSATGTTIGTQTDASGKYTLSVPASAKTLSFSFIGYAPLQVSITSGTVNAALASSNSQLTEVVVVGYTTTTKQSYTGSAKVVGSEQIEKKKVSNIAAALAGEVAGVTVINGNGQPGSTPTIRIRGYGSVNGNRDPLYVIDGIPYAGNLNSINPADIESTVILKDAVATAQYGSRGSAGVVLVTTKSGKNKKPYVEADASYGTNAALIPRYDVIKSPEQYVGLAWEGLYNQGLGLATPAPDPVAYANARVFSSVGLPPFYNIWNSTAANLVDPVTRTVKAGITRKYDPEDWKYYAFQKAQRVETNVKIGGGTEKSGYYMSLGYLNDKGYSIASDNRRLTARLNLNSEVKPWLKATMGFNFANSRQNQGGQTSDSGSIFWFVDNIPPIYELFLRDAAGNLVPDAIFGGNRYDYGAASTARKFGALTNSIADTKYNTNRNDRNELSGNTSLIATIIPGLTFENTFGLQYNQLANVQRNNKFYGSAASLNGSIYLQRQDVTNYNLLDLLRYTKTVGDNNFSVYAAHEIQSYKLGYLNAYKTNLVQNDLETLDNAVVSSPSSSYTQGYEIESYHTQATYDYKSKYFLSGTLRRDGASRFVNNKWGTFGSVGAAWLISAENFMKSQSIVSNLKLRASYGLIGDQSGVGLYSGYNTQIISNVNDQPGLGAITIGNPDLTWESTRVINFAVDFSLGKYIDGSFEYYVKNAINQIFARKQGTSTGSASITVNDGGLRNSAFEFDLTGHILKTKDYHLDLSVNGEFLKNKITAMPIDPTTGAQQVISPTGNFGYAVGHSIFDFYAKKYVGVNPANGNSQWGAYWIDLDGNGTPKSGTIEQGTGEYIASLGAFADFVSRNQNITGINKPINQTTTETYTNAALQYTGQTAIPTVRGAFSLSGGYKGLDLSVQFIYSLGGYAYDSEYAGLMNDLSVGTNNWSTDILRRWQKPGDVTDVPRISNAQNLNVTSLSDRFITKADYLALNNVRLSYALPKSILSKIGIPGLSVWASGDNLWLASKRKGFNPASAEDGGSSIYRYNPLSTFSAGINLKL